MNSEEQAERAGYTSLEEDRKARLLAYEKQLKRFQRLHENAEELLTLAKRISCSDPTIAIRANWLIHKIEGD